MTITTSGLRNSSDDDGDELPGRDDIASVSACRMPTKTCGRSQQTTRHFLRPWAAELARQRDGDASSPCRRHTSSTRRSAFPQLSHTHNTNKTTLAWAWSETRNTPSYTPRMHISGWILRFQVGKVQRSVLIFWLFRFLALGYHGQHSYHRELGHKLSFPPNLIMAGSWGGHLNCIYSMGRVEIQAAIFWVFLFFYLAFWEKTRCSNAPPTPLGRDRGQRHPLFLFLFCCLFFCLPPLFLVGISLWEREKTTALEADLMVPPPFTTNTTTTTLRVSRDAASTPSVFHFITKSVFFFLSHG